MHTKMIAVRVELWLQAAEKGLADVETRGLSWGEPESEETD